MFKSYKYRLYPTKIQEELLNKHFGCVRLIYNLALETKNRSYQCGKNISCFDLMKQLPELKKEFIWLNDINSQSLQSVIGNLDDAFTRFFKKVSDFPNFKNKKTNKSFTIPQSIKINLEKEKVFIPKFQEGIKCVFHRTFEGKIKQATISKTNTDKYFISILVETEKTLPIKDTVTEKNSIGIDVGLKSYATLSSGEVIVNPRYLRNSEERLKILQKRLSKKYKYGKNGKFIKQKTSQNLKKEYKKLANLHEKIKNQRKDFLHKLSSKIVSENQGAVIVEDLNISGMARNHCLAKSIQDASWGEFFRQLKYKCDWYGRTYHEIGRFEPSSKMCSCGKINKELTLADRIWTCDSCGSVNERDLLAAQNILKFGLVKLLDTG